MLLRKLLEKSEWDRNSGGSACSAAYENRQTAESLTRRRDLYLPTVLSRKIVEDRELLLQFGKGMDSGEKSGETGPAAGTGDRQKKIPTDSETIRS